MAPITAARGQRLTSARLAALTRSTQVESHSRVTRWANSVPAEVASCTTNDDSKAVNQYRAIRSISAQREISENAKGSRKRASSSMTGSDGLQENEPFPKRRLVGFRPINQGESLDVEEAEEEEGEKGEEREEEPGEEGEGESDPFESLFDDSIYPRAKKRNPRTFLERSLVLMGLPTPVATPKGRDFFQRALTMDPLIPVDFDGTYSTLVDWENDPKWNQVYSRMFQPWFWTKQNRAATQRPKGQDLSKDDLRK